MAALLLVALVGASTAAWVLADPASRSAADASPATSGSPHLLHPGDNPPTGHDRPLGKVIAPLVLQGDSLPTTATDVLFIGASYTAGLGAAPVTDGYAYRTAAMLGWRAEVDGVAGTGYLNPGIHGGGTFAARIPLLHPTTPPDIVILQSGRNDIGYPLASLKAAVEHTVALVHGRWPGARVVVLGAIPATVPLSRSLINTETALHEAANASGAPFIDPIAQDWITRTNEHENAGPVPEHPGDVGYAYLAGRLADNLRTLEPSLVPSATDSPN